MSSWESVSNLRKLRKKALESLEVREHEISMLKTTLKEKKSLIRNDHSDLTNKCEIIQKRYSHFQEKFNANHAKLKSLEDDLKKFKTCKTTPLYASSDPSSN